MAEIDELSGTWKKVSAWAESQLKAARSHRESVGAELRDLDRELGKVQILKKLLNLPAEQQEHQPDVAGNRFGIPNPSSYNPTRSDPDE